VAPWRRRDLSRQADRPALVKKLRRLLVGFGRLLVGFGKLLLSLGKLLLASFGRLLLGVGKLLRSVVLSKWVAFLAATGALGVGGLLLLYDLHSSPPAVFTRVGGPTRVETAVDASWFWPTLPPCVVYAQADRRQQIMLRAARYAMAHDAPLLFTSSNPKRQLLVDTMVGNWQTVPLISRRSERGLVGRMTDNSQPEATVPPPCRGKGYAADASRVSTLAVCNQLLMHPLPVKVGNTLAPVVVFAAARAPGDSPDVAVGLALAAHMALEYREAVSLVVVPRYLESDLPLENQLRKQRKPVNGGVVLGSNRIVPEDTRTLLGQLLTAHDQLGVLSQIQTNLGEVGPFIDALLALVGGVAAFQIGKEVVPQAAHAIKATPGITVKAFQAAPGRILKVIQAVPGIPDKALQAVRGILDNAGKEAKEAIRFIREIFNMTESDWTKALKDERGKGKEVTVRLRSGRTVTGKVDEKNPAETVFRLNEARFDRPGEGNPAGQAATTNLSVLVPVQDIESITVIAE